MILACRISCSVTWSVHFGAPSAPVPDTTEKFGRKKPPNEAERRALARSFSCARFPPGRAIRYFDGSYSPLAALSAAAADPPPLKWSDLRYVFDIQEDCNGKEAIQA